MIHCLTFDGGGVRGVISSRITARLLKEQQNLITKTRAFAGTSIGAYIAAGLACNIPPDEIEDIIARIGRQTFDLSLFDKILNLWGWDSPAYSNKHIKKELKSLFGNKTIGSLRKKILIASFQLSKKTRNYPPAWTPVFFHNIGRTKGGNAGHSKDLKIVDALLRSSAAPTYFPIYQNCIDGGIIANNPAMALVSQILHSKTAKLDEIILLSVGSGYETRYIKSQHGRWGLAQWLKPSSRHGNGTLIDLLMDGPGDANHFYVKTMLRVHYHRMQVNMKSPIGLSDADKIDDMRKIADAQDIRSAKAWLQGFWYEGLR
jgi:patatin-like phospholipase/acyl hydrolase